ncbi:MAG: hypothetical protein QSU88_00315, partial [Candidatus Methanoperedens sp.]|nr:hypothetical protein [Candidatus Methanoperedens sp.]
ISSGNFYKILGIFYYIFIKYIINTILFDVRDIDGDRTNGVITIPVFFGLKKTKNILLLLNSTLIPFTILSYLKGFFREYLFVLILIILYGYWYILHFCSENIEIGKSLDLLVDGEWTLVVLIVLIFSKKIFF